MLDSAQNRQADLHGAEEFIDTKQVARLVHFSATSLASMRVRGGGPPFYRLGRKILYKRADVIDWREQRRFLSTSDPGPAGLAA